MRLPDEPLRAQLRRRDRASAWAWARTLGGRDLSVWRLEFVKALVAKAEERPGFLANFAADATVSTTSASSWWRRARLLVASAAAFASLCIWMLRYGRGRSSMPKSPRRLVALHGEWATRTRHLLAAMEHADPPVDAIVLVGRLRHEPEAIRDLWLAYGAKAAKSQPMIVPVDFGAFFRALPDMVRLTREGVGEASRFHPPTSWVDLIAIAFRVLLGTVYVRWWERHAPAGRCEVVFGHTGTAETTLLERQMQNSGGFTIHAVHGQAIGPNFVGVSDLALFRSRYDAKVYGMLRCYGDCSVQPARMTAARRGENGLLLLTNLVHPMNADFRATGPADEIRLLECAATVAERIGALAQPRLWKPHPAIAGVPESSANKVRQAAERLGFREIGNDGASDLASTSRFVICSPSTVALDLLNSGILAVVADPQGTITDSALSKLPVVRSTPEDMAQALWTLDDAGGYERTLAEAYAEIGPARELDLTTSLE